MLFGAIGFYGFYILLRKGFGSSAEASLLGGILFLFNGFFAHRLIVGHLTFHSFMLFPLLLYFLISKKGFIQNAVFSSILLTYMFYSGAFHIILPILLSVFICVILYDIHSGSGFHYGSFIGKLSIVLIISMLASFAYLHAAGSFLSNFPRDFYALPGVQDPLRLIQITITALFLYAPDDAANIFTTHKQWPLGKHEFEFGVGILPLVLILSGIILQWREIRKIPAIKIAILLFLLSIPLLMNLYTPLWNSLLKSLPIVKSSSTNIRWLCAYIPVSILLACLLFDKIKWIHKLKWQTTLVCSLFIIVYNIFKDRGYYHEQTYNPKLAMYAHNYLKEGRLDPEIKFVCEQVQIDNGNKVTGNDLFITRASQIRPYEPMFGYYLEKFPAGELSMEPATQLKPTGNYNMKNPAAYVFPSENNCKPGDHFRAGQEKELKNFRKYQPFDFKTPFMQKAANVISLLTISFLLLFIIIKAMTYSIGLLKKSYLITKTLSE